MRCESSFKALEWFKELIPGPENGNVGILVWSASGLDAIHSQHRVSWRGKRYGQWRQNALLMYERMQVSWRFFYEKRFSFFGYSFVPCFQKALFFTTWVFVPQENNENSKQVILVTTILWTVLCMELHNHFKGGILLRDMSCSSKRDQNQSLGANSSIQAKCEKALGCSWGS